MEKSKAQFDSVEITVKFGNGTKGIYQTECTEAQIMAENICETDKQTNMVYAKAKDGGYIVINLNHVTHILIKDVNKGNKLEALKVTRAKYIERELSIERYNKFIEELIAENDFEHPNYEQWRKEIEADIIEEANEKQRKGEFLL